MFREDTLLFVCLFILICFFIDVRERGGEMEREKETWIKIINIDQLPPAHSLLGISQQPGHVPCLGIQPATSWCMGQCSTIEPHRLGKAWLFIW
jgi:hypothetical protein